jgi:hypothetical protein
MNGLVPVEPFIHQTLERRRDSRRIAHRNLVFDHHVCCPVELGVSAEWQVIATVVVDDLVDAFGLIEGKPGLRIGLITGIVAHGKILSSRAEAEAGIALKFARCICRQWYTALALLAECGLNEHEAISHPDQLRFSSPQRAASAAS